MKIEDLKKSNECRIIIATYQMASEGYDNPELDTLILASPKCNVEQAVGRILRKKNKNGAIVIDIDSFKDNKFNALLVESYIENNPGIIKGSVDIRDIPNNIYIDKIIDLKEKARFINTCDARLWARIDGETFGLSIGEFSSKNKPVIAATIGSTAHIHLLGDKGIWYSSLSELYNILTGFNPSIEKTKDWNAFRDYTYDKVMDKFNEVFIKPLEIA
jgi:hypothetical protein